MQKNKIKLITISDNEKHLRQTSLPVDIKTDEELQQNISILRQFCEENEEKIFDKHFNILYVIRYEKKYI